MNDLAYPRILIVFAVAVLLLGIAGGAVYFALQEDPQPPDLTWKTKFPAGYDQHPTTVRAAGYDGASRCLGLGTFVNGYEWVHEGITYTEAPTAEDVLDANPLTSPAYQYTGTPTFPQVVQQKEFEPIQADFLCQVRYGANIWEVQSDVRNYEPIEILDAYGQPLIYALTDVELGGNGEGDGGTRFLLQGSTTDPQNLTMDYQVFDTGEITPAHRFHRSSVYPTLTQGNQFVFILDVPNSHVSQASLMLIPHVSARGENRSLPSGSIRLDTLWRLETEKAEVQVGTTIDASHPTTVNVKSFQGADLETAWTKVAETVDDLEAISHSATLVEKAFEPRVPAGVVRHVQHIESRTMMASVQLDIQGVDPSRMETAYRWTIEKESRLVISWTDAKLAGSTSQVSGMTAAVTQVGADGLAVVSAVGSGPSAQGAVESAKRVLDARGQVAQLGATEYPIASARQLLEGPQKYFLAAGALAAAWEWLEASRASDITSKLLHQLNAAEIVAETIFSLTPQGAIFVAAAELAQYALSKVMPPEVPDFFVRAYDVAILGKVSKTGARNAFEDAAPRIQAFAHDRNASILQKQQYAKTVPAPAMVPLLGMVVALVLARRRPPLEAHDCCWLPQ